MPTRPGWLHGTACRWYCRGPVPCRLGGKQQPAGRGRQPLQQRAAHHPARLSPAPPPGPVSRLQAQFAAALKAAFAAEAQPLASAAVVNSWVAEATRGKIKDIIDEGMAQQASVDWLFSAGEGSLPRDGLRMNGHAASCQRCRGAAAHLHARARPSYARFGCTSVTQQPLPVLRRPCSFSSTASTSRDSGCTHSRSELF